MGTTPSDEANRPFNVFEWIAMGATLMLAIFAALAIIAIGAVYAWRFFVEAIS